MDASRLETRKTLDRSTTGDRWLRKGMAHLEIKPDTFILP